MKKILYLFSSFDPIHNGHILIAKKAIESFDIQKCLFMMSNNYQPINDHENYKKQFKMAKIALKRENNIKVKWLNCSIRELINKNNDKKQYLLIGSDELIKILNDKNIISEINNIKILVYRRDGFNLDLDLLTKYNISVVDGPLINISSSKIRELNSLNTDKRVLDYIINKQLYYYNYLRDRLKPKRLIHSISVANLCYEIALNNKLNANKAYHAGLIHDIAKYISPDESKALMDKYYPEYKSYGKFSYHQFLGEYIAKTQFKINDEEILKSIKFHATGNKNMSPIAMIVYASDKIDPNRGWDSSRLIKKCKENYYDGFIETLKANIEYFNNHNVTYDNELTLNCINEYLKEKN